MLLNKPVFVCLHFCITYYFPLSATFCKQTITLCALRICLYLWWFICMQVIVCCYCELRCYMKAKTGCEQEKKLDL